MAKHTGNKIDRVALPSRDRVKETERERVKEGIRMRENALAVLKRGNCGKREQQAFAREKRFLKACETVLRASVIQHHSIAIDHARPVTAD